jgi:acetyl-CoA acetyltransferase
VSRTLRNRAAIAGIGQTEFSKESGRSELQLACEAIKAALDDAGLAPREVDGLATFTMDSSEEAEVGRNLASSGCRCSAACPTAAARRAAS